VPRLLIVIPVLGESRQLDDTLLSVLENRPANCEILVVHDEPYLDPYELSDEVRFVEVAHGSLAECLNQGFAASRSPVVHVIACGVEVRPGWVDIAMRHFDNPDTGSVAAVLVEKDDDRSIILSAGLE